MVKRAFMTAVLAVVTSTVLPAAEFQAPVMLKGGDKAVRVEAPGYACPCWTDIDGDGNKDLLVGQFANGQIRVYRNLGDLKLAEGEWLQAGGEVAAVPGVW
jgi:FG-GAP-like repeat